MLNLISEIPIARQKANKFCNARQRQLIGAAAIRGGREHMGAAATEIRGGGDTGSKKWNLRPGGDAGAVFRQNPKATAEGVGPQRRSGSFEFSGDFVIHPHHHSLPVGVDSSFFPPFFMCSVIISFERREI